MPSSSHQLDDDVRGLEDLNAFRWELVTHTEGTREAVLRIPVDAISQSGDMLSKFGNHDRRQQSAKTGLASVRKNNES